MAETKYGKYIITKTPENPIHRRLRFGTPLYNVIWVNNEVNGAVKGAPYLECQMVSQASPERIKTKPHNHDFDEYLIFMGTNPDDPLDLGGEVELWMGEEGEKHFITQSCAVFIPKGMYHLPLYYNRVDRPMVVVITGNTLKYRHLSYSQQPEWADGRESTDLDNYLKELYSKGSE
ncbi:hypothetical protein ACFLX3_01615 [Chloroflexota bacterium]